MFIAYLWKKNDMKFYVLWIQGTSAREKVEPQSGQILKRHISFSLLSDLPPPKKETRESKWYPVKGIVHKLCNALFRFFITLPEINLKLPRILCSLSRLFSRWKKAKNFEWKCGNWFYWGQWHTYFNHSFFKNFKDFSCTFWVHKTNIPNVGKR